MTQEAENQKTTQNEDVFSQAQQSGNTASQGDQEAQATESPSPTDSSTESSGGGDLFHQLVGEGRKFKTPEDLARAKAESDRFIEQLKQEQHEMRQTLEELHQEKEKLGKVDERLRSIESLREEESRNHPGLTEEEIERKLDERLTQHEKQRMEQERLQTVQQQLLSEFGNAETASKHLAKVAEENDMEVTELRQLAVTKPKLFQRVVGLGQNNQESGSTQPNPNIQSSVNTNSMDTGHKDKTMSYYLELKRKDPTRYFQPDIQQQKWQDAERLGEAFFDVEY